MKETYRNVDYKSLFEMTGDPFVDAGGFALEEFASHFPDLDILELIVKATNIYVDWWDAKIDSFFLNSKITQHGFKSRQKKEETEKYFRSLLEEAGGKKGICRLTGKKCLVFPAGRDNMVLGGSRAFINFHHSFEEGLLFSKEVLIKYFFLPLACEQVQGKIALISSNTPEISRFFSQEVCKENLSAVAHNNSTSINKTKANNPSTALFRYADHVIIHFADIFDGKQRNLVMYHFTNFGTSPSLSIYNLPFQTLQFYSLMQKVQYKDFWHNFVRHYYYKKGIKYNKDVDSYEVQNKKQKTIVSPEEYQYWSNVIYDYLLNNKSIIPYLLSYSRIALVSFKITRIYAIKIRHMKKESIDKIEQIADFITACNDCLIIEKAIKKLDSVTNSYLLRRFVLKDIIAKNYEEGNKDAIVTVNEYADYLFPDLDSWMEMRDVLLIAIYERLHQLHKDMNNDNEVSNN
ncbi:hypothetical protein HMPREF0971_01865 [Segatella oris F0302]|uniref:CRISPR-associated protein, Cst1 family n=2 Tax=Segatella oris TaxID=28135 RepID=D1QSA7_9BACT|nr:hypothetical protein [Segatella oris]EFB31588.1 hypothetical protein HMPREF0971_01865 [Segatella oris F0302]